MNDSRCDALTRRLTRPYTRRTTLAVVLAALVARTGLTPPRSAAGAGEFPA